MGVYLRDHPPRTRQYRSPRREKPSGVIALHSTESLPDVNPPDTGSNDVARFIRDRTNYGSYHFLCDSDSHLQLVRLGDEAFHDGTGTNRHSIGISGAFRAHQFASLPLWWRTGCIQQMALAARESADWVRDTTGVVVPARRISVAQARNRVPGFVTHGMLDPKRRTDPDGTNTGARFPWSSFFDHFNAAGDDDDMTPEQAKQLADVHAATHAALMHIEALGRRVDDVERRIDERTVPTATVRADIRTTRNIAEKVGAEVDLPEEA